MVAAKDNVNTKSIALISLVGVVALALIILATDGAYAWSESLAAKGNEAGMSSKVVDQRKAWADDKAAESHWVDETKRKFVEIPIEDARRLVLEERAK